MKNRNRNPFEHLVKSAFLLGAATGAALMFMLLVMAGWRPTF